MRVYQEVITQAIARSEPLQRTLIATLLSVSAFLVAYGGPCLASSKRVALVVGNASYLHASILRNPRNDAEDISASLERLGFEVISGFDLGHLEMGRIIRRFASALDGADVGVFFYAGHGIQIEGVNYLVPTDSRLENEHSRDFELIRADVVQRIMERRQRTNILFLDACRDNPLARNLARAMGTRSTSIGRGLAATESGIGTLVSFSTQPGNVALDGTGRNSPYAEALARHLAQPGTHIADMLINVRRDVIRATGQRQVPWEHSALTDRFYFSAAPIQPDLPQGTASSPATPALSPPDPAPPAAAVQERQKVQAEPVPRSPTARKGDNCRLETWTECMGRTNGLFNNNCGEERRLRICR